MRRPRRTAPTIEAKLSFRRTRSAASRATSAPRWPIATPIWAASRAGASLTPSPVMATISPSCLRACTILSFCSGAILAKTRTDFSFSQSTSKGSCSISDPARNPAAVSMPAPAAIDMAVAGWSPVIMTTLMPAQRASWRAWGTSERSGSMKPIRPEKRKSPVRGSSKAGSPGRALATPRTRRPSPA